jgi:lipopolysaccharide export system permease protein
VGITEHVFNESFKDMNLYVHHLVPEQDLLEGVLLADQRDAKQSVVVTARTGHLLGEGQGSALMLEMENGAIHRFDLRNPTVYEIVRFAKGRIMVDLERALDERGADLAYLEMDMNELTDYIKLQREHGGGYVMRRAWVEYHKRFAFPFVCVVFGLIALPLGVSPPRSGRSRGFAASVIVLCAFYLLFRAGENLGWKGVLHPVVAMWTPLAIGLLFGLYLLKKKSDEAPIWLLDLLQYGARNLGRRLGRRFGLGADENGENLP